jgi:hypothetical protein
VKRFFFLCFILFLYNFNGAFLYSQCCSAGGGSPIAGGASQGVLLARQMELNANFQYVSTTKFLDGDSPDKNFLDSYSSKYGYFRVAYGITKDFTMSLEAGHYFNKRQVGLNRRDTIETNGWGDMIIFPRYDILNKTTVTKKIEITVGVGLKIPLGNEKDTLRQVEPFSGMEYYILKPPAIRNTTGSHDFIFYTFFYRGFPLNNLRFFSNCIYIKKGWNQLGEKAGDYASVGLFASKTFHQNFGVTIQLKGEWIAKMKTNDDLALFGLYNYDPEATGSKKVFVAPQLSYTHHSFTIYLTNEFPVYQYVNKQQIASQYFITSGVSYRFTHEQKTNTKED